MKRCTKCKKLKHISRFGKRTRSKGGISPVCLLCCRQMVRATYRKNPQRYIAKKTEIRKQMRELIVCLKSKPCTDCGKEYPPYCMDFDHKHDKKFNISASVHSIGMQQLKEEIAKCDVVCAICHRIRTHERKISTSSNSIIKNGMVECNGFKSQPNGVSLPCKP